MVNPQKQLEFHLTSNFRLKISVSIMDFRSCFKNYFKWGCRNLSKKSVVIRFYSEKVVFFKWKVRRFVEEKMFLVNIFVVDSQERGIFCRMIVYIEKTVNAFFRFVCDRVVLTVLWHIVKTKSLTQTEIEEIKIWTKSVVLKQKF